MNDKTNNFLIEINDLSISYMNKNRKVDVYKNFNLNIGYDESITILGESGSGKSTLANFMIGILPTNAKIHTGNYILDNKDVFSSKKFIEINKIRGSKIAFIFQDAQDSLNPIKKIYKQFEELLLFHNICKQEDIYNLAKEKLSAILIKDPDKVLNSYPFELSGGMCQRICITMCLCLNPKLIIADEPTSALDILSANEVLNNLNSLKGISKLIITHDISVAAKCSDRIIVLKDGNICEQGSVREIITTPKELYTKNLIDAYQKIPYLNTYKNSKKETILEAKNIHKSYKKTEILKGINFEIYKEEIFGIIGESGCGKSTLSRCIMGLEKHVKGEIIYDDKNLLEMKKTNRRFLSQKIQMIFQNSRAVLNPSYSAKELVMEPLIYNKLYDNIKREDLAEKWLNIVGIDENMHNSKPPQLSTGQCQRVSIARALVVEPEILICDESVSALDVIIQEQILKLLADLKKQFNLTIIIISHDIRVLKNYCDRIAIMKKGIFISIQNGGEDFENTDDEYTRYLLKNVYELEDIE